jgi:hypothetical protein
LEDSGSAGDGRPLVFYTSQHQNNLWKREKTDNWSCPYNDNLIAEQVTWDALRVYLLSNDEYTAAAFSPSALVSVMIIILVPLAEDTSAIFCRDCHFKVVRLLGSFFIASEMMLIASAFDCAATFSFSASQTFWSGLAFDTAAFSREVMFFSKDQLPARSEITSRHFCALRVNTEIDSYEVLLGTMKPAEVLPDGPAIQFVRRVLNITFPQFEKFLQMQLQSRLDTPVEPEQGSASDMQLWEITQLISSMYPGSLCEISEMSTSTYATKVLASSVSKPWEPSPWEPAKSLEMLSEYASQTGVPLVVQKVEHPWTIVIEGVETELRYL